MKFSIGDPVHVKSTDEEGVIISFVGQDMAVVKVDGSEFHAYIEDLEHPYLKWFMEKNAIKKKDTVYIDNIRKDKNYSRSKSLGQGVYLVFMPQYKDDGFEDVVYKFKIYLYNETDVAYQCSYESFNKTELVFSIETQIVANSEFYLHDMNFEDMAQSPLFLFRFLDVSNPKLDLEGEYTLKPKRLYELLHKVRHENKPFFSSKLFEEIVERKPKEVLVHAMPNRMDLEKKEDIFFDFKKALKKSTYEVDLHIEKLVENWAYLSPSEMLHIQLEECRKSLEMAIATHQRSIVLIHGVGKGRLKREIHGLLNQTKGVLRYVFDYDSRYGYGATEVFFA